MTVVGQLCLLLAMICSGYAAFAAILSNVPGTRRRPDTLSRSALIAGLAAFAALTAIVAILAHALVTKNFAFEYVGEYSDPLLPWHYSLSALWVGQAGSLLVWGWFVAALAIVFWLTPSPLRSIAFGVQMIYLAFLLAIMVFAADPMAPALTPGAKGEGLSPLLQHPAMLVHPPIVFLGYAAWGVPFALAAAALISRQLDTHWLKLARPWALFAWTTLGAGILLGAEWAYEQLGWGGYWAWDPVENGSLMPWLTGTAFLHGLMTWKLGSLKKTTLALAIATFALCNLATFLTRSGIFSSLHAFSKSPIGWMFLLWIAAFIIGGTALIVSRRRLLIAERPLTSLWSRESLVLLGVIALTLLTSVALVGTLTGAISGLFSSMPVIVGPAFYNNVLIPTGLVLLAVVAAVPLLRWNARPTGDRGRLLTFAGGVGLIVAIIAFALGVHSIVGLAVAGLIATLVTATLLAISADSAAGSARSTGFSRLARSTGFSRLLALPFRLMAVLQTRRRSYGGLLVHLGFGCIAVGIAGSSLGSRETDLSMTRGESVPWAGRTIRYAELLQRDLKQKVVVEARLEITEPNGTSYDLLPAQNLYRPQNQWGTKVAIHSTFAGDFYVILHGGSEANKIHLTLIDHPLIRWLWLGGWIGLAGVVIAAWPERQPRTADAGRALPHAVIPRPHIAVFAENRDIPDHNPKRQRGL
jgi:cytochrome c-type biogenesis protein CcmF